ncbi:MAG: S4 domain-containing protein [Candidatus Krumholzibacteriales bacterium]
MRLDLLLKNLCLVKSRTRGKEAVSAGRVKVGGISVKPSREIHEGEALHILYPSKELVIEVLELPPKQVSRKNAGDYYRVIRERKL